MEMLPTKQMAKELDRFLSSKTITDVDRTKYLILSLKDFQCKLTTTIIFNCNSHQYEDPIIIPCEYSGAVIHLPAFWVEVPKELAFSYIVGLINQVYKETYKNWETSIINPPSSDNTVGFCCPIINSWREV